MGLGLCALSVLACYVFAPSVPCTRSFSPGKAADASLPRPSKSASSSTEAEAVVPLSPSCLCASRKAWSSAKSRALAALSFPGSPALAPLLPFFCPTTPVTILQRRKMPLFANCCRSAKSSSFASTAPRPWPMRWMSREIASTCAPRSSTLPFSSSWRAAMASARAVSEALTDESRDERDSIDAPTDDKLCLSTLRDTNQPVKGRSKPGRNLKQVMATADAAQVMARPTQVVRNPPRWCPSRPVAIVICWPPASAVLCKSLDNSAT
mmetsp:Transcript_149/g.267  ORF Transcript_149/g.267 Transcript_149/m.267 type:complete len:266 (+) Transcript_149:235-1032(+)